MRNKEGLNGRIRERMEKDIRRTWLWVMDIAIAVLCLTLAFSLWFMISSFISERDEGYSAVSLHYALSEGNYPRLLEMSNANRARGIGNGDADYEEYYAVADYFEAVTNYYICEKAGDAAGAEKWWERMKEAEAGMGSLSGERERICQRLGIAEHIFGEFDHETTPYICGR